MNTTISTKDNGTQRTVEITHLILHGFAFDCNLPGGKQ